MPLRTISGKLAFEGGSDIEEDPQEVHRLANGGVHRSRQNCNCDGCLHIRNMPKLDRAARRLNRNRAITISKRDRWLKRANHTAQVVACVFGVAAFFLAAYIGYYCECRKH